jgi:hypothetical protein
MKRSVLVLVVLALLLGGHARADFIMLNGVTLVQAGSGTDQLSRTDFSQSIQGDIGSTFQLSGPPLAISQTHPGQYGGSITDTAAGLSGAQGPGSLITGGTSKLSAASTTDPTGALYGYVIGSNQAEARTILTFTSNTSGVFTAKYGATISSTLGTYYNYAFGYYINSSQFVILDSGRSSSPAGSFFGRFPGKPDIHGVHDNRGRLRGRVAAP